MEFNATFIVSMISFLLFVFVMNKIFYAPITKIVNEREEKLKNNYDDAQWFNQAAKGILRVRDEKLAKTEAQSRHIIADKIETYNNRSKRATTEAAQKSAEEIKTRKNALHIEKQQAELELKAKTKEFAELISSKVMGLDVSQKSGNKDGAV
ncbi:ATP synthase F0 subunit B [bacterium]|nr:ATP synthase F0 subunit B [bacterium]